MERKVKATGTARAELKENHPQQIDNNDWRARAETARVTPQLEEMANK